MKKKLTTLMLLISFNSFFANNNIEIKKTQSFFYSEIDCKIARKNLENHLQTHGFTKEESAAIADAAYKRCVEINGKKGNSIE